MSEEREMWELITEIIITSTITAWEKEPVVTILAIIVFTLFTTMMFYLDTDGFKQNRYQKHTDRAQEG